MKVKRFNDNLLEQNSYLIKKNNQAIVFDPGLNGEKILEYLKEKDVSDVKVILTHGHFDHIKGVEVLAKEYVFDLYISSYDKILLFDESLNYAQSFSSTFQLPNLNLIEAQESNKLEYLDEAFEFISTPGHTKGSICIKVRNHLITGDTLFYNSIGRTDLYSGNQTMIYKSLRKLVSMISNDTMIYPGHGPSAEEFFLVC